MNVKGGIEMNGAEQLKKHKLSDRARVLLLAVYEETDRDWTSGELRSYFVPSPRGNWVESLRDHIMVQGTDAQILKSLHRKGLTEQTTRMRENVHAYSYALTEDGLQVVEAIRDELRASGYLEKQQARIREDQEEERRAWAKHEGRD